jgi:transcriptional regulator GlxA family with amidase domain
LIRGARLARAWQLLDDRKRTLEAVAANCGQGSAFRLIKAFDLVVGVAPRKTKNSLDIQGFAMLVGQ